MPNAREGSARLGMQRRKQTLGQQGGPFFAVLSAYPYPKLTGLNRAPILEFRVRSGVFAGGDHGKACDFGGGADTDWQIPGRAFVADGAGAGREGRGGVREARGCGTGASGRSD